jgi:hypothetical protein
LKHTFKNWVEVHDVFGFEKELYAEPKPEKSEKPIKEFSLTRLTNSLGSYHLGVKEPEIKFINEVWWGQGPGSVRVWIGTGLNVMIERMNVDLQGMNRWGCKRVYQIPQESGGGNEESIAQEIMEVIKQIDMEPLDSAHHVYEDLEELAATMANTLKKTAHNIFIFEGVRKIDETNYIIRFSVRGSGAGWRGQQRIEENQTQLTFDKDSGLLRLTNYNVKSPMRGHLWQLPPKDTDWYFFPTQDKMEIVETICNTLYWY